MAANLPGVAAYLVAAMQAYLANINGENVISKTISSQWRNGWRLAKRGNDERSGENWRRKLKEEGWRERAENRPWRLTAEISESCGVKISSSTVKAGDGVAKQQSYQLTKKQRKAKKISKLAAISQKASSSGWPAAKPGQWRIWLASWRWRRGGYWRDERKPGGFEERRKLAKAKTVSGKMKKLKSTVKAGNAVVIVVSKIEEEEENTARLSKKINGWRRSDYQR